MLNCRTTGSIENPPILFLHGFLGDKEDWMEVASLLSDQFYCISIDLPGPDLVENMISLIEPLDKCHIVGYSMGGRLALALKKRHPKKFLKTIAISAHPGLKTKKERQARWEIDLKWAEMLETKSMNEFLEKWYSQSIFDSLCKKKELLEKVLFRRSVQEPKMLASLLRNFSLAHQTSLYLPSAYYLCGKEDLKYSELYSTFPSFMKVLHVPECGHAMHLENPARCAREIRNLFND